MLKTIISLCLISLSMSATWDYLNSGGSWVGANDGGCATTNTNQSPIDVLSASATASLSTRGGVINLPTRGTKAHVDLVNNGHTIQMNPETGKYLFTTELKIEGNTAPVKFNALQFHFHAPSENYIDGVQGQLEIHFVMLCDSCDSTAIGGFSYAVLGFIFKLDQYAPDLKFLTSIQGVTIPSARLLEKYPEDSLDDFYMRTTGEQRSLATGQSVHMDFDVNEFFDHIPQQYQFLNFRGGLTTPPCSQVVNWFLASQMLPINAAQLKYFTDLWVQSSVCTESVGCGNNRKLQSVSSRTLASGVNTLSHATPAVDDSDSKNKTWLIVILIVVCFLLLIMLIAVIVKSGASGAKGTNYNSAKQNDEP